MTGTLWIGTQGGLARFDGVRFVGFDQRTQPDWSSDEINALCASRGGDLWVGTLDGGLLRFRGGAFTHVPLPSATVRALHEARDGTLWVAMDRGLARLRKGGSPDVAEMFAATYVYAFHEDPDGSMWLGTSGGLYVHRQGEFEPAGVQFGLPYGAVNAIWRGADQVLWVGTAVGGLYRIPGSRAEAVSREDGPIWSGLDRSRRHSLDRGRSRTQDPATGTGSGPLSVSRVLPAASSPCSRTGRAASGQARGTAASCA